MSSFHSLPGADPLNEEQKAELEEVSKRICRKAFNQYGEKSQVSMLMGECAELIAAINRFSNQNRGTIEDVVERWLMLQSCLSSSWIYCRRAYLIALRSPNLNAYKSGWRGK